MEKEKINLLNIAIGITKDYAGSSEHNVGRIEDVLEKTFKTLVKLSDLAVVKKPAGK